MPTADPRARARDLRTRLNGPGVDVVAAAEDARLIFAERGDLQRVLWLALEIGGYGALTDAVPLHLVLGIAEGDRLARQVAAYRTQVGFRWMTQPASRIAHFFVEPLAELRAAAERVTKAGAAESVELTFGPHAGRPDYPTSAEFSADVFQRILLGFTATLHLHLGDVA